MVRCSKKLKPDNFVHTSNSQNIAPTVSQSSSACNSVIKCVMNNARSLKNKLINLWQLLSSCVYDVLVFTETWLSPNISDSLLTSATPYKVVRCDRSDGYGGVAIFARDSFSLNCRTSQSTTCLNFLCLDIDLPKGTSYRFISLYLPPPVSSDTANSLIDLLDLWINPNKPTFLCGDLNLPHIDWSIPINRGDAAHETIFPRIILHNWLKLQLEETPS